ncbi:hypothetical protein VNI00_000226 [Paramarasmius palmivorus]|uniref:Uncharacterized protein n=1 Tax=Paramarasmius palmivorus TaxID=297713 RepID=A0AAW0EGU9_9AGAR
MPSCLWTRIDALLNIAGVMDGFAGVDNLQDSDWERTIAINLTAPTKLMREVVNKAAVSGAVSGAAYAASKHGLLGITKNTAWLYKDDNIRCNAILPGGVATNIAASVPQASWDMASLGKLQPVHSVHYYLKEDGEKAHGADPSQAASVLLFLASDASKGVSGAAVPVDNAWSTI